MACPWFKWIINIYRKLRKLFGLDKNNDNVELPRPNYGSTYTQPGRDPEQPSAYRSSHPVQLKQQYHPQLRQNQSFSDDLEKLLNPLPSNRYGPVPPYPSHAQQPSAPQPRVPTQPQQQQHTPLRQQQYYPADDEDIREKPLLSTYDNVGSVPPYSGHNKQPSVPQPRRPAHPQQLYRTQLRQQDYYPVDDENVLEKPSTNDLDSDDRRYKALRAKALARGDSMAQCYKNSKEARKLGDHVKAAYSNDQGRAYAAEQERLDKQASEGIFKVKNKGSMPNEVDLHGLYVKEAVRFTEDAIIAAQKKGYNDLRIIVGKGLHSEGAAKLKPAIKNLVTQ
ncbi:hypothetical protein FRB95_008358 [Tulasnella sp. JGI-2019a]|nr:hypothetical protein FRB95_008358 [Tulasnella sp. JGI-2019a]